jgi:hypothetical protein
MLADFIQEILDLVWAFFVAFIISCILLWFFGVKDPAMMFVIYLMAEKYRLDRKIKELTAVPTKS